jgi:hypothetical protein
LLKVVLDLVEVTTFLFERTVSELPLSVERLVFLFRFVLETVVVIIKAIFLLSLLSFLYDTLVLKLSDSATIHFLETMDLVLDGSVFLDNGI